MAGSVGKPGCFLERTGGKNWSVLSLCGTQFRSHGEAKERNKIGVGDCWENGCGDQAGPN